MWSKSYDAAALKSVVLDMRRWLPSTPHLVVAPAADGAVLDVRDMEQAGDITVSQRPELEEAETPDRSRRAVDRRGQGGDAMTYSDGPVVRAGTDGLAVIDSPRGRRPVEFVMSRPCSKRWSPC